MEHRKTIRHIHEPGHLHELTFSCFHQKPLLTNDDWCGRLARSLDAACEKTKFQLVAFVFMPDHVHLLVNPREQDPSISHFLDRLKQPFSKEIKSLLSIRPNRLLRQLTVEERPGRTCFRFWQEGPGYDRNIYSREAVAASMDYIHNNPVKKRLCERAVEWKWSSARYYLSEPPAQQLPGLPHIHGLPMDALD